VQIHGLCLVKNESDIIRQGLQAARAWCDWIYVLDNGSTDGTWETVQELARQDEGIVPWKQADVPFHDGLRAEIFHAFADRAQPGDWWARVDPDEFYVDDPREFLANVSPRDGCVWYASLSFYFSTEEARRYRANPEDFADDVPITEKCRHYFNHWSETRFVRHEALHPWPPGTLGWPEGIEKRVRTHRRRILCRHFSYRSPQQIERRLATRAPNALTGQFSHEGIKDWRSTVDPVAIRKHKWQKVDYVTDVGELDLSWESRVIDARHLVYDAHDDKFVLNEHLMPPLPGTLRAKLRGAARRARRLT
jgi:hypothetical protein